MRQFINIVESFTVDGHDLSTPEFQAWFKGSKIVDENGKPKIVYHQTSHDNADSIWKNGFDVSRVGARGSDEQMPNGIFFKPTNEKIRLGRGETFIQMPFVLSVKNPLVLASRRELAQFLAQDSRYSEWKQRYEEANQRLLAAYDRLWDAARDKARYSDEMFSKRSADLKQRTDTLIDGIATKARAESTRAIRSAGYDGLIVERDDGAMGASTTTILIFDPAQARRIQFTW